VGIAALVVTVRAVQESRDPAARRPDWIGLVTFSTGLAALVYGLIRSNEDGWSSGTVVGSLVASAVLLVAFVLAEAFGRAPMFDLGLLRKPTFVGGLIGAFGISASLFATFPFLVLYLQSGLHLSAMDTGVRFLVISGPTFVTAAIAGRLTDKVPTRLLIGPGFALVGLALLLMRGIDPAMSWAHLIPGFLLAGIGSGLINVPLASTAVGVVEPARAGMASGINSTLRQVGIATGVAALGAIFSSHVSGPPALSGFVDGLNSVLLVGAIVALTAAVFTLVLIRPQDFVQVGAPAGQPRAVEASG
jgi:predicted MFS family arabinose efflux permease